MNTLIDDSKSAYGGEGGDQGEAVALFRGLDGDQKNDLGGDDSNKIVIFQSTSTANNEPSQELDSPETGLSNPFVPTEIKFLPGQLIEAPPLAISHSMGHHHMQPQQSKEAILDDIAKTFS